MNWYQPDKAVSLFIEFKKEGEFVIPDPSSLMLTVRANTGLVMTGYDELVLPDCSLPTLTITVPPAVNTTQAGSFETRFIRVDFTSGGEPLFVEQSYRVSSFIPLTATPIEVRSIFGARDQELPDHDIDLVDAYYLLLDDYPTVMVGSLTSSITSRSANRAVVLTAALQLLPSMPGRLLKEDSMNTATQIRDKIDWEALQAKIYAELGVVLGKLQSAASVAGGTSPTPILVLAGPSVDPITNA